jgi:hypothetical protein
MSPDINRILVLFLLVGSVLAVSASFLLMRLYRNAVQRRMSSFGRETVPGPERAVVHRTPASALQMRTSTTPPAWSGPTRVHPLIVWLCRDRGKQRQSILRPGRATP